MSESNEAERLLHGLVGLVVGLVTAVAGILHLRRRKPTVRVSDGTQNADTQKEDFTAESVEEDGGTMVLRIQSSASSAVIREIVRRQLAISIAAYRNVHELGGAKLNPHLVGDDSYQIEIKHNETDEMWAEAFGAIMRQHDVLLAEKPPRPKAEKIPMYWLNLAHKEMKRVNGIEVSNKNEAIEFMSCVLNITTYLAICLVRFGVVETFSYSLKEEE